MRWRRYQTSLVIFGALILLDTDFSLHTRLVCDICEIWSDIEGVGMLLKIPKMRRGGIPQTNPEYPLPKLELLMEDSETSYMANTRYPPLRGIGTSHRGLCVADWCVDTVSLLRYICCSGVNYYSWYFVQQVQKWTWTPKITILVGPETVKSGLLASIRHTRRHHTT